MKSWIVSGAVQATGRDTEIIVEAADQASAEQAARAKGILVSGVSPAMPSVAPAIRRGFSARQTILLSTLTALVCAATLFGAMLVVQEVKAVQAWNVRLLNLQDTAKQATERLRHAESEDYGEFYMAVSVLKQGKKDDFDHWIDSLVEKYRDAGTATADLKEHLGRPAYRDTPKDVAEYRDRREESARQLAKF